MTWRRKRMLCSVMLLGFASALLLAPTASGDPASHSSAASEQASLYPGQPLSEALVALRNQGLELVFSDRLVSPHMTVLGAPGASTPNGQALEILEPHGLTLEALDNLWLVVRLPVTDDTNSATLVVWVSGPEVTGTDIQLQLLPESSTSISQVSPGIFQIDDLRANSYRVTARATGFHPAREQVQLRAGDWQLLRLRLHLAPAELAELSVSASRYLLFPDTSFFIDQRAIQALPDFGEDPLRAVHRLPGAAASGLSARSHFRGGEEEENAVYLNGLKLVDPFHIRDYHNIFSSIDARAISGVEAYTGGFPADYGEQMSGVLLLESQRPGERSRTEVGVSIYNTSLLHSGFNSDGSLEWLGSVRRSNLDLLLSDDLGKPDYFDVFTEFAWYPSDRLRLSFNALYANDQVTVITESDPEELEQSVSDTRNTHIWFRAESEFGANARMDARLWLNALDNRRVAEVNDPERMHANVTDDRRVEGVGVGLDWKFSGWAGHTLRAGLEAADEDARFDYRNAAEYFEFAAAWPDIENPRSADFRTNPTGRRYALWLADRWRLSETFRLDLGLRWDRQTYSAQRLDGQFSPRFALLQRLGRAGEIRLSWGKYHQAQAIQRLQIEDGLTNYFSPQESTHSILGWRGHYADQRFRIELYSKDYQNLKPRFENLFDPLVLIPELAPDRVRLDPRRARARGLEMGWEYQPAGRSWEVWANYSFSRVSDRFADGSQPRSWDQRHAVQAGMAIERGPWQLGLALSWRSGWPITGMQLGFDPEEDEYFPLIGERNAEQLGNFASIDFRLSREFPVQHGRLSAFLEVSNASNRRNECCLDFDIDENDLGEVFLDRSVDNWLPLLPAVGILWEF